MELHPFRLKPGQDLRAELSRFVGSHSILAAAVVTCVGSLRKAKLRMADASAEVELDGPFEIVSLVGTLGLDGCHLHISLSDRKGQCVGGHLLDGSLIHTTAEVILVELRDVRFSRVDDADTGYRELRIDPI